MSQDHDMGAGDCPFVDVIDVVGGKWRGTIIYCLARGKRRFNELKREAAPITKKVLAQELRAMERDGLLTREQFPELPPRVEYSLTDLGRTLRPIFDQIYEWRLKLPEIMSARGRYDAR